MYSITYTSGSGWILYYMDDRDSDNCVASRLLPQPRPYINIDLDLDNAILFLHLDDDLYSNGPQTF